MIIAFITSINKPSVMKVIGNVNNTKIGFTKKLSKPNTTATVNAVENLSTTTPFMKWAIIKTKAAVINILISIFISLFFKISFSKTLPFLQKTTSDFRRATNVQHLELLLIQS